MIVKGKVISGSGSGHVFTELDWAKRQFVQLLGFEPFPGTLNIMLEETTNQGILELRQCRTLTIYPPDNSFSSGVVLPAVIDNTMRGAIVIPQVHNYEPRLLEIVAPINLRQRLRLKDGDTIALDI